MASPASGPSNEFSLQCSIEAAPEQQPGKPVIVKGTLRNGGSKPIRILSRSTFLDAAWRDCLSITRGGEGVPYLGPIESRGGPAPDTFIRLGPGDSRSADIDISEQYNVWMSGDYEIFFRMSVVGGDEQGPMNSARVESGRVSFRMAGAKAPILALEEWAAAAFRDAHRWAYESIIAGLVSAQRLTPYYATWFDKKKGDGWQQRQNTVVSNLKAMVDWLSTTSVVIARGQDNRCDGDRMAYTSEEDRRAIELCRNALDDSFLKSGYGSAERGRAFLLVHEISHGASRTKDRSYNYGECQEFARTNPDFAISSAQNYAEFALDVYPNPSRRPDHENGIWRDRSDSGGGGRAEDGPAAIQVESNVVMVAFRGPRPSRVSPEAPDEGGPLFYKIVKMTDGGSDWKDATPFRPAFPIGHAPELMSLVTPALARWGNETYCAYIDFNLGLLSLKALSPKTPNGPASWQDLKWTGSYTETEAERISDHGRGRAKMRLSPALAEYAGEGGKSRGLYCAYVNSDGMLCCSAKLGAQQGGLGRWSPVKFDKSRRSTSGPALAVLYGQLKCAYLDADQSRYVVLTFHADSDSGQGSWVEDKSFPDLMTNTIALAEWESAQGPRILAVGSVLPIGDRFLRYSVLGADSKWSEPIVTEYLSKGVPALVKMSLGPTAMVAFITSQEGNIQSIRARS